MAATDRRLVADVRPSEMLDRVILAPRAPASTLDLKMALGQALPGLAATRLANGVAVPAVSAPSLLMVESGIEFVFSEEARAYCNNRVLAQRLHPTLQSAVRRLRRHTGDLEDMRRAIPGGGILDDHQVVNVTAMAHPAAYGLCIFDEQGAGKTVSAIYAWDLLVARDEADVAIIAAPKSMVMEWVHDFQRFRGDLYVVRAVTGSRQDKRAALAAGADVFVTNFESIVTLEADFSEIARRARGRALLIADESFLVKNLDARRTRALRRVREWCGRAYVLCGTPAPNAALDLVQQFNLADFGVTFDGVSVPKERQAAATVVKSAIRERGVYLRHLKRDVLPDLPPKSFDVVHLELEPLQSAAYHGAKEALVTDLKGVNETEFQRRRVSFSARRIKLLQICSNPSRVLPGYSEIPAKLRALDSILEELVTRRAEKVVIWSFFKASLDAIADRYGSMGVVRYDGRVTEVSQRRQAVRRFQEDSATRVFLGNPAAAGAGLTLHAARYAIYESFSNQTAHYLQSLDRIHRRGQSRDVRYLILLCRDTIEEAEFARLRHKEADASDLFDDNPDEPLTREGMLNDLI